MEEDLLISVQYDDRDAINTIRNIPQWWSQIVTAGRSSAETGADELIAAALQAAGALGSVAVISADDAGERPLRRLEEAFHIVHADLLARPLDPARRAVVDDLVESALAIMSEVGRNVHAATATQSGTIASINRSAGGAPKIAVDRVAIGAGGLDGDRQRSRQHHGRPWQAVSLWSYEVIESLQAAGHPVRPGSAGENVTLAGLDWSRVGPGMIVAIGDVVLECSMWAEPCRHIAHCFSDGRWTRIHHEQGPVSRLYASVRHGGIVQSGDPVIVEPR